LTLFLVVKRLVFVISLLDIFFFEAVARVFFVFFLKYQLQLIFRDIICPSLVIPYDVRMGQL
jgi:hypothetical protein